MAVGRFQYFDQQKTNQGRIGRGEKIKEKKGVVKECFKLTFCVLR